MTRSRGAGYPHHMASRLSVLVLLCAIAGACSGHDAAPKDAPIPGFTIAVAPDAPSLVKGLTQAFTATQVNGDGTTADVTSQVTWSTADSTIATIDATGLVTGTNVGSVVVNATLDGVTGEATLTVTAAQAVSMDLTPSHPFVATGYPQQLHATLHYTDATTLDVSGSVQWQSSAPSVIAVSSSGLASFVKIGGSVTLTATDPATSLFASATVTTPPVAFITSATGAGNLGAWANNGGNTSVAAANSICQTLASNAGLSGTFAAWISDDTTDAYCNVHGLTGKKSAKCGQAALPTAAGPWVRTDGFPFAPTIDKLTANEIVSYTPLRLDENAVAHYDLAGVILTGTSQAGAELATYACSNWSSSSSSANLGVNSYIFTPGGTGGVFCNSTGRLQCMQVPPASPVPVPAFAQPGKIVFVSSSVGTANLGSWAEANGNTGVAAGDAICQSLAAGAGFANASKFKAWLSTDTVNAIDRLASNGPWVRPDGVPVAATKADLGPEAIFTGIAVTDDMHYLYGYGAFQGDVWTGTTLGGLLVNGSTCNGWTVTTGTGIASMANYAGGDVSSWSNEWGINCSTNTVHLYCFEDQ